MKYRGVRSLPNSVSTWLEQRLEEQGIDSSIYSRYIVSLLQHDSLDQSDLPDISKCGRGRKVKSWQSFDPEELKRSVVVKCLSAASEQACGIENLVDELCVKLKEVESEGSHCLKEKISNSTRKLASTPSSPESVHKYYRAFPALSRESGGGLVTEQGGGVWGRNRKTEGSPRAWRRKDKENISTPSGRIRSRSMGKQVTSSGRGGAKSLDRARSRRGTTEEVPPRVDKAEELCELPVDFQQLLRSPEDSEPYKKAKRNGPLPNFIQCGTNIISSIWSEKMEEETPIQEDVWCMGAKQMWADIENTSLAIGQEGGGFFTSLGGTTNVSGLNHGQDSGFTEVVPKCMPGRVKQAEPPPSAPPAQPTPAPEEEEDLLTSMKTHFRPIKQDSNSGEKLSAAGTTCDYVDGTTFLVSASLEELHFTRSASGALYLGSDNKYMEYKPNGEPADFIPKFKVCQSEKFCQTDTEESAKEVQEEEGFFFPGDDRLAEDMVTGGGAEEEDEENQQPRTEVRGWLTTWPLSHIWSNSTLPNKSWVFDGGWSCGNGNASVGGGGDHCLQLRHELTEEGEALLSDLSSIHLFLDPETPPNPQAHYPKRMRIRPCPFRSGYDSLI